MFRYVYVCVCVCEEMLYRSAGAQRGQKRAVDALELELLVVVSHPTWVLGIELQPSAKAAQTFRPSPPSPALLSLNKELNNSNWFYF